MKRIAQVLETRSRLSERQTGASGTFPKTGLHESGSASEAYSHAIELVSSKVACTDMRDLLRLVPELFEGVVKIEIDIYKKDSPPLQLINALVDEERVYFTGTSNRTEPFASRKIPLILQHGEEATSIGDMHVLGFRPISLDPLSPNDAAETDKVLGRLGSLVAKTIDAALDGLTALPIRKYFDRSLAEKASRFRSEARSFCLIIIDLDHFKRVNDEFGHQAGDKVLSETAMVLMNGIRGRAGCIDTLFRIGGEEFGILLSDVSVEEAARIAERLRMAVKAHDFGLAEPGNGKPRQITCSVGVADVREVASSENAADAIYKLADGRLYEAKGSGRDSVVSMKAIASDE